MRGILTPLIRWPLLLCHYKQELRQKGLDTLLIEQAIEDLDVDWFEICQQAKEKKFSDSLPVDAKEKAKMIRYLQYRGHSMAVIMEILTS
ncbi:regulatory protein RecX [Vibrio vulnificus]|uniref:regulatory protein RecX n=1 Tax=Vibrio vulnificus TaxID=672 RepID=UPI001F4E3265|nr:regulatory protein RecX [Vibrio vulnificus]